LNTGEIVNVDDSGCVLRMAERGEKVTEPKNFGDTVGERAELRNGSGSANQRAEPGARENGGTIEEAHVGNGALPARMVIHVAGIGVTNENIGAGMSPAMPKTEARRTGKVLDYRMRALPRGTAPLGQVPREVVRSAGDVGASLREPKDATDYLTVRQMGVGSVIIVGDDMS
jgi:hypothetical protein